MGKPVWPNDSTSTFVVKASSWCEDAICFRNFFETSALETLLPILWVGWCCNICSINSLSQLALLPTLWVGWTCNICITNALSRLALQYLWRCKDMAVAALWLKYPAMAKRKWLVVRRCLYFVYIISEFPNESDLREGKRRDFFLIYINDEILSLCCFRSLLLSFTHITMISNHCWISVPSSLVIHLSPWRLECGHVFYRDWRIVQ